MDDEGEAACGDMQRSPLDACGSSSRLGGGGCLRLNPYSTGEDARSELQEEFLR